MSSGTHIDGVDGSPEYLVFSADSIKKQIPRFARNDKSGVGTW
jgi:hypothetical protein